MTGHLQIAFRAPRLTDLEMMSALCLKSKAVWGYDAEFLAACRDELTFRPSALTTTEIALACKAGKLIGVVQWDKKLPVCELLKLFVDPGCIGQGIGKQMFNWATTSAAQAGADTMHIEADPNAVPFYTAMGAELIGAVESASIGGRTLPLMQKRLRAR